MFLITKVGGNCIAAFVDLVERICWRERCNAENTPRLVQGAYMQLKGVMHRILLWSTNSLAGVSEVMGRVIHCLADCHWTPVVTRSSYPRSQLSKILMWRYHAGTIALFLGTRSHLLE